MKILHRYTLAALLLAGASGATADTWPQRPIRLVVPFAAGSASDVVGRLIAEPLAQALGQPIVLENRPGANSTVGTNVVAKAAPDGYTLALATNAGVAASPAGIIESMPYDAAEDLSYVSLVGAISYVWIANVGVQAGDARQMVDYIKANPGKLNYASGNTGGIAYGGFLQRENALDIAHIAYKSTPPALVDLIGGQVQVMMADVASAAPMIASGKVKALGVPLAERNPLLPDVPTFAEQGMPTPPDMSGWWVVVAPKGTPDAVLDRLNAELVKVLGMPEIRRRLLDNGIVATPSSRAEATQYQREQLELWKRMVNELNLKVG